LHTQHRRTSLSPFSSSRRPSLSPSLLHISACRCRRAGRGARQIRTVLGPAARGGACGGAEARGGVEVPAEELAPGLELAPASLCLDR
jgi:hypothetical protein